MVNYSHMLVAAVSVTAVVLLVKYRNLTALMAEEEKEHMQNQKLLLDDLGKETERTKVLNEELNQRMKDIKLVEERLQGTQDELSNSVRALQASNDQIETLKLEKQSLLDDLNNEKELGVALQNQVAQEHDELQKTRALVDDNTLTIKDAQDKQEKLLSENTRLSQQITSLQAVQEENKNLRAQVDDAINAARAADAKVKDLESQLREKRDSNDNGKENEQGPKGNEQQPTADKPKESEPEPPKDAPKEPQQDNNEEANNVKEEPNKVTPAQEPQGKNPDYKADEKAVEKDIEVYDMLDDEEKAKLKRELSNNEDPEVAGGGEVVDKQDNVLEDGEGRELDNQPAEEDDEDLAKENKDEDLDENNNELDDIAGDLPAEEADGNVLPQPKAVEEMQESGSAFDVQGERQLLSWQDESSNQKN